jgi:hypothetical protein
LAGRARRIPSTKVEHFMRAKMAVLLGHCLGLWLATSSTSKDREAITLGDFASHLMTALVGGIISGWLTYVFALRRFRTEKWWERRADAYEKIVDALHSAKRFSDVHLERLIQGSTEPTPDEIKELREQSKAGHDYILRAIDTGRLILPDEPPERLDEYSKENARNHPESWHDYLNNDYGIIDRCIIDIAKIARKDLGADPTRPFWSDIMGRM